MTHPGLWHQALCVGCGRHWPFCAPHHFLGTGLLDLMPWDPWPMKTVLIHPWGCERKSLCIGVRCKSPKRPHDGCFFMAVFCVLRPVPCVLWSSEGIECGSCFSPFGEVAFWVPLCPLLSIFPEFFPQLSLSTSNPSNSFEFFSFFFSPFLSVSLVGYWVGYLELLLLEVTDSNQLKPAKQWARLPGRPCCLQEQQAAELRATSPGPRASHLSAQLPPQVLWR